MEQTTLEAAVQDGLFDVNMQSRRVFKPLLRWPGSKRAIADLLRAGAPQDYRRYFEPFAGSAALFFALAPRAAVLNDFNEALVETYLAVRDAHEDVATQLRTFGLGREDYYAIRDRGIDDLDTAQRAARFIYLNYRCFNGVYRTNRRNQFNVPMGSRLGPMPSTQQLSEFAHALKGVEILCGDFVDALAGASSGDFVYLDPPYPSVHRPGYGEYGYGAFCAVDEPRLAQCMRELDARGCKVLLSYCAGTDLDRNLEGWGVTHLTTDRRIGGRRGDGSRANEVLISNLQQPIALTRPTGGS